MAKSKENVDTEDKHFLVELIKEYSSDIENKKTDYHTNKKKTSAWENVITKFNSQSGKKRSPKQIKDLWKRLKINAKKNVSSYKRNSSQTGGGKKPPEPDDLSNSVMELCKGDLNDLDNPYDDDAAMPVDDVQTEIIDR